MKKLIACLLSGLVLASAASWHLLQPRAEAMEVRAGQVCAMPKQSNLQPIPVPERFRPLQLDDKGYSGTSSLRINQQGDAPTREATLPLWGEGATDDQLEVVVARLAKAGSYDTWLRRMYELGGKPEVTDLVPDEGGYSNTAFATRFQHEPERMAALLMNALKDARGIARQNLIFQLALALPDELAFEKLRGIRAEGDAEDNHDALCAMGFRGEPGAMAEFEALARQPDEVDCNILCDGPTTHDRFATEGKRDLLRSYRCIELLDFRPYFHLHAWSYWRGAGSEFTWADRKSVETRQQRDELAKRLLPSWIRRYPKHPGGDDMAWRMSKYCAQEENWLPAAEWASRCATWPDQDMTQYGVGMLTALAECFLETWQLDMLLQGDEWQRNREFIQYIRLRRLAADDGFESALRDADFIAKSEPDSFLGECFECRWYPSPPDGLKSGIVAISAGDPLFHEEDKCPKWRYTMNPTTWWAGSWEHMTSYCGGTDDERRLRPPLEAVRLSSAKLTNQFRLWETQAELERRRDAVAGDERADLEYKLAAVYYHNYDVLFPVYARKGVRSGVPGHNDWWLYAVPQVSRRMPDDSFASHARSAELFEQLAADHPDWAGRDKALFSAAMSWIKLVDNPTAPGRDDYIRKGTALFERTAREHPTSSLADDATNAASYWRRVFANVWREEGVVEDQ